MRIGLLFIFPLAFLGGALIRTFMSKPEDVGAGLVGTIIGAMIVWIVCWVLWMLGSVRNPFSGRRESVFD